MSSNCTDKQKSAALYVAHQLGTILFGYKMMTDTSGADTIDESRLESVSATVKAKEDTVIGGSLTYANSMLAIARKYVDFAKDVKGTQGMSEYKNAIAVSYTHLDVYKRQYMHRIFTGFDKFRHQIFY